MFSIPTPQTLAAKVLAALVGVTIVAGAGAYGGYRWELGAYEKLVAANAKALAAGIKDSADRQHRIDVANAGDAEAQAYLRGKLEAAKLSLNVETPANVTVLQDQQAAASVHAGCVTYGFARVLYAGAHGVTPESLNLPSGESVDACTGLEPSELAAEVSQDLAAGYGNGQQLDALIGAVKRNDALATGQ